MIDHWHFQLKIASIYLAHSFFFIVWHTKFNDSICHFHHFINIFIFYVRNQLNKKNSVWCLLINFNKIITAVDKLDRLGILTDFPMAINKKNEPKIRWCENCIVNRARPSQLRLVTRRIKTWPAPQPRSHKIKIKNVTWYIVV